MANWKSRQLQFEDCVDRYADSMYRVAYRLTTCRDSAEELLQETYVQAWNNLDSLRDVSKMRAWLFGILRNQYLKWIRMRQKSPDSFGEIAEQVSIEEKQRESAFGSAQETVDVVQRAVKQLEENHRLPLLLVAMEQMPVEEAAEILEIPKGTLLSRLHRGRQKLKQILAREMSEFES